MFGAIDDRSFSIVNYLTASELLPIPTKPNFVFARLAGEVENGEHQFLPTNASVKYFDLKSIAYAISIESGTTPLSGTINVVSTKAEQFGGSQVSQQLVFNANLTSGQLVEHFNSAVFESTFTGLVAVTVTLASQLATTGLALVEFDRNVYVAYIEQ